jgi:hypothetical protein
MAAEEKERWYLAKKDGDCILAVGVCGNLTAVNKAHVKAFEAWASKVTARSECDRPTPEGQAQQERLVARCVNGRCIAVDPQPPEATNPLSRNP